MRCATSRKVLGSIPGRVTGYLHVPSVKKSGSPNLLDPSKPRRPVTGILYLYFIGHSSVRYSIKHDVPTCSAKECNNFFNVFNRLRLKRCSCFYLTRRVCVSIIQIYQCAGKLMEFILRIIWKTCEMRFLQRSEWSLESQIRHHIDCLN